MSNRIPKVSVLMPTFNQGVYISDSIKSVIAQTFVDFELIIVDNASTDNTQEVVHEFLNDDRIKYYRNKVNIGGVNNFNRSYDYSQGQYIKYLFSDDLLVESALESYVKILNEYDDVVLVTSHFEFYGTKSEIYKQPFEQKINGLDTIRDTLLKKENWIGAPSNVMFRRSCWDGYGFNPNLRWWTDLDMWFRIINSGSLFVIPEVLSKFRYHDESVTSIESTQFSNLNDSYFYTKHLIDKDIYGLRSNTDLREVVRNTARQWLDLIPYFIKLKDWKRVRIGFNVIRKEKLFFEFVQKMIEILKYKITKL